MFEQCNRQPNFFYQEAGKHLHDNGKIIFAGDVSPGGLSDGYSTLCGGKAPGGAIHTAAAAKEFFIPWPLGDSHRTRPDGSPSSMAGNT